MNRKLFWTTSLTLLCCFPVVVFGQEKKAAAPHAYVRLFWQDQSEATIQWGDVHKQAGKWQLESKSLADFPAIDVKQQSLVQMQADAGVLFVGVHDDVDGTIGSGWVAIETGVHEEEHGDHSHWRIVQPPHVCAEKIDLEQGNPAHVYRYGSSVVLANDKRGGMTFLSAAAIRNSEKASLVGSFVSGGGGHITLAVQPNQVAYATWIDREGEHAGQIDVVALGTQQGKGYSLFAPTGGLHGATVNHGKAIFAPAEGICWVEVDRQVTRDPQTVQVHSFSLGTDDQERPLRTGAFHNYGKHVLFTAGKAEFSKLVTLDASVDEPALTELPVPVEEGEGLSTPVVLRPRKGSPFALMFAENRETPEEDRLVVVKLDPDGNGDFSDAVLTHSIPIGKNQIEGHSGHHGITLLPGRRHFVVSNPGDGSLWMFEVDGMSVIAKFQVDGTPTRMIALGG